MAFDEKTKACVRRYYVFDLLTLEQAAEKAGVAYNTARRWKKEGKRVGDDWDKVRDAHTVSGGRVEDVARGMLTTFVLYFDNLMNELKASEDLPLVEKVKLIQSLGDNYTKMVAASKRLVPEVSELATAMRTVELLGSYLQQNKPELLGDYLDLLEGFGVELNKAFKD